MKNFKTKFGQIGIVTLAVLMLLLVVMPAFGDYLPTSGKTYDYSDETIEAEKIYDSIAEDLTEAQKTLELAKLTYEQAVKAEQSIQVTLCAQQLVLGQLKYGDTDPDNTKEIDRLTISINNARACLGQPVMGF